MWKCIGVADAAMVLVCALDKVIGAEQPQSL